MNLSHFTVFFCFFYRLLISLNNTQQTRWIFLVKPCDYLSPPAMSVETDDRLHLR